MGKSSKSKIKLYNPDEPYATCVSFEFPMDIACSVCKPASCPLTNPRKIKKTERGRVIVDNVRDYGKHVLKILIVKQMVK